MPGALTHAIAGAKRQGLFPVISEIKPHSPKEGDLLKGRSPSDLARRMARCPIAGLSVVTEPENFGGSLDLLGEIAPVVDVPILQKDFIRTRKQVEQSKALGASAILLIANMLDDGTLVDLQAFAHEVGLETVVEVHTGGELRRVMDLGIRLDLLGINNRDISVLETDDSDVAVTEELLRGGPASPVEHGAMVVSESSLRGPEDVRRAFEAGADAVLIGTSVLRAEDTEAFLRRLIRAGADNGQG